MSPPTCGYKEHILVGPNTITKRLRFGGSLASTPVCWYPDLETREVRGKRAMVGKGVILLCAEMHTEFGCAFVFYHHLLVEFPHSDPLAPKVRRLQYGPKWQVQGDAVTLKKSSPN